MEGRCRLHLCCLLAALAGFGAAEAGEGTVGRRCKPAPPGSHAPSPPPSDDRLCPLPARLFCSALQCSAICSLFCFRNRYTTGMQLACAPQSLTSDTRLHCTDARGLMAAACAPAPSALSPADFLCDCKFNRLTELHWKDERPCNSTTSFNGCSLCAVSCACPVDCASISLALCSLVGC